MAFTSINLWEKTEKYGYLGQLRILGNVEKIGNSQ